MVEVTMAVVLFAGVVLCVWLDQRGRTRRRELEHVERLRALDMGRPLDDAETGRTAALATIGVGVGVSSFAAAAFATCFVLYYLLEGNASFLLLLVIWPVCALVAGGVAAGCIFAIGRRRPSDGGATAERSGASQQVTTRPREYGP